jgi:hypothetical protein
MYSPEIGGASSSTLIQHESHGGSSLNHLMLGNRNYLVHSRASVQAPCRARYLEAVEGRQRRTLQISTVSCNWIVLVPLNTSHSMFDNWAKTHITEHVCWGQMISRKIYIHKVLCFNTIAVCIRRCIIWTEPRSKLSHKQATQTLQHVNPPVHLYQYMSGHHLRITWIPPKEE